MASHHKPPSAPLHPSSTAHLFQSNLCVDELIYYGLRELSVSQEEGGDNFIILQHIIYLQAAALIEEKKNGNGKKMGQNREKALNNSPYPAWCQMNSDMYENVFSEFSCSVLYIVNITQISNQTVLFHSTKWQVQIFAIKFSEKTEQINAGKAIKVLASGL